MMNRTLSASFNLGNVGARLGACAVAVFVSALIPGSAFAAPQSFKGPDKALGNFGEVFHVQTGSFGNLFPENTDVEPQLGIMVLDIHHADGMERLVVPGTDTWRPELYPMVSYDDRNDALMIFWATGGYADQRLALNMTSFRNGEWLPTTKIRSDGEIALIQGIPRVAVTSDDFFLDLGEDHEPFESRRTTFHVVWHEPADGTVRYSPVSFLDGELAGWSETLPLAARTLKSNSSTSGDAPGAALPPGLVGAVSLERARESDAVALTLTDPTDGSVVTLRIEEVPMSLAHLAAKIQAHVADGFTSADPADLAPLADEIRAEIIITGARCRINPAVSEYLAAEISSWIAQYGQDYDDASGFSEDASRHAMEVGSEIYNQAVIHETGPQDVLDLATLPVADTYLDKLNQLIRIRTRGSFQAPSEVGENEVHLFTSDDGHSLLVSWLDEESQILSFMENRGLGWSEPQGLQIQESLPLATAFELLQRKIH